MSAFCRKVFRTGARLSYDHARSPGSLGYVSLGAGAAGPSTSRQPSRNLGRPGERMTLEQFDFIHRLIWDRDLGLEALEPKRFPDLLEEITVGLPRGPRGGLPLPATVAAATAVCILTREPGEPEAPSRPLPGGSDALFREFEYFHSQLPSGSDSHQIAERARAWGCGWHRSLLPECGLQDLWPLAFVWLCQRIEWWIGSWDEDQPDARGVKRRCAKRCANRFLDGVIGGLRRIMPPLNDEVGEIATHLARWLVRPINPYVFIELEEKGELQIRVTEGGVTVTWPGDTLWPLPRGARYVFFFQTPKRAEVQDLRRSFPITGGQRLVVRSQPFQQAEIRRLDGPRKKGPEMYLDRINNTALVRGPCTIHVMACGCGSWYCARDHSIAGWNPSTPLDRFVARAVRGQLPRIAVKSFEPSMYYSYLSREGWCSPKPEGSAGRPAGGTYRILQADVAVHKYVGNGPPQQIRTKTILTEGKEHTVREFDVGPNPRWRWVMANGLIVDTAEPEAPFRPERVVKCDNQDCGDWVAVGCKCLNCDRIPKVSARPCTWWRETGQMKIQPNPAWQFPGDNHDEGEQEGPDLQEPADAETEAYPSERCIGGHAFESEELGTANEQLKGEKDATGLLGALVRRWEPALGDEERETGDSARASKRQKMLEFLQKEIVPLMIRQLESIAERGISLQLRNFQELSLPGSAGVALAVWGGVKDALDQAIRNALGAHEKDREKRLRQVRAQLDNLAAGQGPGGLLREQDMQLLDSRIHCAKQSGDTKLASLLASMYQTLLWPQFERERARKLIAGGCLSKEIDRAGRQDAAWADCLERLRRAVESIAAKGEGSHDRNRN